jgi:hypothetical protein
MTSDNITSCHAFYIDQLIGVAAGGILLLSTSISPDLTFFYTGILFLAPGTDYRQSNCISKHISVICSFLYYIKKERMLSYTKAVFSTNGE